MSTTVFDTVAKTYDHDHPGMRLTEDDVPHKAFGQGTQEDVPEVLEPVTFDLADTTNIVCRPKVNGKLLIQLVGQVDSPQVSKQSEGIIAVFDVVVQTDDGDDPDSWTGRREDTHTAAQRRVAIEDGLQPGVDPTSSLGRLLAVLDDPNTEIEINELAELVGWLVEKYTGRPTKNAATSRHGVSSTNRTSRRARRSTARIIDEQTQPEPLTSSTASS